VIVHVSPHEGKSFWLLTDLHTLKVVDADSDGAFTLTEVTANPGFGPPPHTHHRQNECFYVLEGTFEFFYENRTFTADAGSVIHLPKGRVHNHRAVGNVPARALVVYTPAGLERFLEEAGKPAVDRSSPPAPPEPPELEKIVAIAKKYGIEVPTAP
jgi:quercetin dioxygenase-like cupin family protein